MHVVVNTPGNLMRVITQAIAGLAFLLAVLGAALFGAAGTLAYWQAWAFLAVFGAATAAITIDLSRRDPALLARRVRAGPLAEPTARQKLIQGAASAAFLAIFVVAGLDRRAGWSRVSAAVVIVGDLLALVGLAIVAAVFRANTYTSAVITVERDQAVVTTGPYRLVRHPMYAGALVLLLGAPLALASWWGLAPVAALGAVIVARLLDEERVLARDLPGYAAYRARVHHRLVPYLW
jgi:protein-S-isoprenylcysteine O-methyltransferase Ste14